MAALADPNLPRSDESFARCWDIAAYDAAYLILALRKKVPLATWDELLKRKALDEGIEILG